MSAEMVKFAHAALIDAGHPELCDYVRTTVLGQLTIDSPCPAPHTVIQAVALAHRASGHLVTIHRVDGAAGFDCFDCGLVSAHSSEGGR
jgi:hypothetical protein